MVDRHLEVDLRADGRQIGSHPSHGDVALQHRRVHEAGRVTNPRAIVGVQHHLVDDRGLVLGRDQTGVAVVAIPFSPIDGQPDHLPARGLVGELALHRSTTDESSRRLGQLAEHPPEAELDRRRALLVVEGKSAGVEIDTDQHQACLDAGHQQRALADGQDTPPGAGLLQRVPHLDGSIGTDPQLVAEVAGVARARDVHWHVADLGGAVVEEAEAGDLGIQRLEDLS